jgi:predicted CXXCH cytochrome family protein
MLSRVRVGAMLAAVAAMTYSCASPAGRPDDAPRPAAANHHAEESTPAADRSGADVAAIIAGATRGVVGSKHDFSGMSGREGDACRACHIPHVLTVGPADDAAGRNLLEYYRMGSQRDVLATDLYTPGPSSLMCMSCHNGTVASSVLGSAHAILAGQREGFALPDGWAVRDHPVGVTYPDRADGYRLRTAVEAEGRIPLPHGRVECTSCHDPHNRAGEPAMLVVSNRRSALCLSCHVK